MKHYASEAKPKATAGGVPVFCAHDAIVAIEKLVPNPKNPNQHPDGQELPRADIAPLLANIEADEMEE